MFSSECGLYDPCVLIDSGELRVVELVLTINKVQWLWTEMRKYRSLFSDLTRGDPSNFSSLITLKDSYWLEIIGPEDDTIGIVYWTNLYQLIDADVHSMFFDRKPAEKVDLCKEIARLFFTRFPQCHRMTATLPVIYHATIRLARRIGFVEEGTKRQSQLMGSKYVNEVILGLLAEELL